MGRSNMTSGFPAATLLQRYRRRIRPHRGIATDINNRGEIIGMQFHTHSSVSMTVASVSRGDRVYRTEFTHHSE